MDRFIARKIDWWTSPQGFLKSNMDRFIASIHRRFKKLGQFLKSNMDRFIARKIPKKVKKKHF